jgi:hypothetical protein
MLRQERGRQERETGCAVVRWKGHVQTGLCGKKGGEGKEGGGKRKQKVVVAK